MVISVTSKTFHSLFNHFLPRSRVVKRAQAINISICLGLEISVLVVEDYEGSIIILIREYG